MDASEWGARQMAREERLQGSTAFARRANWINEHGPLSLLGALVWDNETEFTALCSAIAQAGPTMSTGDTRMAHVGNSLAFQALYSMSGGENFYEAAGQFVRSLDVALGYSRSIRAHMSDEFRSALDDFNDALGKSIDERAARDVESWK